MVFGIAKANGNGWLRKYNTRLINNWKYVYEVSDVRITDIASSCHFAFLFTNKQKHLVKTKYEQVQKMCHSGNKKEQ
jgi:hypothetical protein